MLLGLLLMRIPLLLLTELSEVLRVVLDRLVGLLPEDGVWLTNWLDQHRLIDRLWMMRWHCKHVLLRGRNGEVLPLEAVTKDIGLRIVLILVWLNILRRLVQGDLIACWCVAPRRRWNR